MDKNMLDKFFDEMGIKEGNFPCVYRLTNYGNVVYVGSTCNLRGRIASHYSEGEKPFTSVEYQECEADQMLNIEADMIVRLVPEFNKTLPKNDMYISKSAAFATLKGAVDEFLEKLSPVYVNKSMSPRNIDARKGKYVSRDLINEKASQILEGAE